jgi:hypothetical protein
MVSNAWKSFLLFGIAVNSLIYPPFLQSHDSVGPSAGTKNQWSIFFQIGNAGRELENKINGPFVFRLVMHDETLNIKTTFPDKSNRPKTGLRNGPPPDETLNIKSTFPDKTNGPKTGLRKGPTNDETLNIKSTFSDKTNGPKTGAQNGSPHDETLNIKSTFPDKSNHPKTGLRNGPLQARRRTRWSLRTFSAHIIFDFVAKLQAGFAPLRCSTLKMHPCVAQRKKCTPALLNAKGAPLKLWKLVGCSGAMNGFHGQAT